MCVILTTVLTSSVASIGISDHCLVTVVRKHNGAFAKTNAHKTIQYRDFKHFDEHMLLEQLINGAWTIIDMTDNVEVNLDLLEQIYISVLNELTPILLKRC